MLLIAIRVCILYVLVIVGVRLMGKRQMGEMQPYELVVTIFISELAAIPISDLNIPLFYGIMAILVLFTLEFLFSMFSMHSLTWRRLLNGTPQIIISNGEIQTETMRRTRINLNDIMEQLRIQNIYDIDDVRYAILETNGALSVIRCARSEPPDAQSLGIDVEERQLARSLIIDGELCQEHLQRTGIQESLLLQLAQLQGIDDLREVFFAQLTSRGQIIFIPYPESERARKGIA